jgi:predicted MFS family arabinose efflux permease
MMILMTLSIGMAMAMQQSIVTNYFSDVIGLEGPQFGYITAIREIPGFLLIFMAALFYKMSLPRYTSLAFIWLALGYMLFPLSDSFATLVPFVVLSSMGYHTIHQNNYALGMSMVREGGSGALLGRLTAVNNAGALLAMLIVMAAFYFDWFSYTGTFILAGTIALLGALAIFNFPHLRDGQLQVQKPQRQRFVLRREYRYYYYLNLLDGGRQQIFFSFGVFVLVAEFGMSVPEVSAVLILVRLIGIFSGSWIGRMIDLHGEKQVLSGVNFGYIVALGGYALVHNVYAAALFYLIYSFIMPLSGIGSATYLRKVAVQSEIAPSLAMGVTLQHAASIVVPISAGIVLNYTSYQVPFLIACIFACFTIWVTRRLDPRTQKSPARIAEDADRAAANATPIPVAAPVAAGGGGR